MPDELLQARGVGASEDPVLSALDPFGKSSVSRSTAPTEVNEYAATILLVACAVYKSVEHHPVD
jgi:hypothetical protein